MIPSMHPAFQTGETWFHPPNKKQGSSLSIQLRHYGNLLSDSFTQGVWHSGGTIQCHLTCWKAVLDMLYMLSCFHLSIFTCFYIWSILPLSLQGSVEFPSAGGELRWVILAGQWSFVRYLLPHFEADHPNLWWPEPSGFRCHEWCDLLLAFPWAAELWFAQDCCEPGAVPTPALLHDRLCTIDLPWLTTISCPHCSRVDPADTGQE